MLDIKAHFTLMVPIELFSPFCYLGWLLPVVRPQYRFLFFALLFLLIFFFFKCVKGGLNLVNKALIGGGSFSASHRYLAGAPSFADYDIAQSCCTARSALFFRLFLRTRTI